MKRSLRRGAIGAVAAVSLGTAAAGLIAAAREEAAARTAHAAIAEGERYLAVLAARLARPRDATLREDALQAAYIARVETGIGSPFRVVEAALRDPWIADSLRRRLASGLLARIADSSVRDVARVSVGPARAQVIDSVVRAYDEPRKGEEVVRVAFELAAASLALPPNIASAAWDVAALSRDAVYARRDVERLLGTAERSGLDAVDLVPVWRAARLFEAERPIVHSIPWAASAQLLRDARALFGLVDTLREGAGPETTSGWAMDGAVARTAAEVAARRDIPPAPAIVQVVAALPPAAALGGAGSIATDEALAAAWLRARRLQPWQREAWARATLAAAVKLRPSAQERTWFPGDEAPRPNELTERYGVRAVTFAAGLRPAWRDYALRVLDGALADARRVLPQLDLTGLRIHVGTKAVWPARAMALHDPRTRTLYFPLSSGPGVLAHELGHDLDWQAARVVLGSQGVYATDGVARRPSGVLAGPVERLTAASARRDPAGTAVAAPRPTEAFARHVDWVLAAALATMARSNGILSTVQESGDALGNARPPEAATVEATVHVLSAATMLPDSTVRRVHGDMEAAAAPQVRSVIARATAVPLRLTLPSSGARDALVWARHALREGVAPQAFLRCAAGGGAGWTAAANALVAEARARAIARRAGQGRRWSAGPPRRASRLALAGPVEPAVHARAIRTITRELEWELAHAMTRSQLPSLC
ncbi:MAG: hypothetical protein ACT4R6_09105 [Gemmatimonadaceae bacterium]